MNPATEVQSNPTGDGVEVWPSLYQRKDVESWLAADMRARDQLGRERYGVPLRAGNGRNALVDAYQEALDLLAYLQQSAIENGNGEAYQDDDVEDALFTATHLGHLLRRGGR